jgi:hypothetical protein
MDEKDGSLHARQGDHQQQQTISPSIPPGSKDQKAAGDDAATTATALPSEEKRPIATANKDKDNKDKDKSDSASSEDDAQPPLPMSKARCIALVATVAGAAFLNVRTSLLVPGGSQCCRVVVLVVVAVMVVMASIHLTHLTNTTSRKPQAIPSHKSN